MFKTSIIIPILIFSFSAMAESQINQINDNSNQVIERADVLIDQAQYDSAAYILNRHLLDAPRDYKSWYLLGFVYNQKENLPLAKEYYYKSLAIDSTYFPPYRDLAYLFDIFVQYDSMNIYMRKAILYSPDPESLYYDFGYSFDASGKSDSAIFYYRKALKNDSTDIDALLNIGAIWGSNNNIDSARVYTLKALAINPNYPQSCYNYAEILKTEGNSPKAIDYYQKALVLDTMMIEAKLRLGELYESLGDSAMAKLYFQEFVNTNRLDYLDDINRVKAKLENYR